MKKYRVYVKSVTILHVDVEAESIAEADDSARDIDGGDYTESVHDIRNCWGIIDIVEVKNA